MTTPKKVRPQRGLHTRGLYYDRVSGKIKEISKMFHADVEKIHDTTTKVKDISKKIRS